VEDPVVRALIRVAPFIVLIAVISLRLRQGKLDASEIGMRAPDGAVRFLAWWGGFCALILVTEVALWRYGLLETTPWRHELAPAAIRIVGMIVLAPVAEELLFRGVLLNFLRRRIGNVHAAVLVQALAFVAVHSFAYDNSLGARIGVVQTFVDAVLFGYARLHTRSILTPIAMHATGNAVAVAEMMLL
jgi:membrane protease YdiL (CAAX protease family)